VDLALTQEQELIRASAREFADREIAPHARDWDRAEELDRGLVAKLADAGYLGRGLGRGVWRQRPRPVGKYLRDARVATLYEGTSQIQKLIIGRALTGESAFT
jgi:alkylation response protein AidB-like acyl-CoA dehydrogenase